MQFILRKALVHTENKLRLTPTNCLFNPKNMKDTDSGILLQQTYRVLRRLYTHTHFIETIHLEMTDSRMRNKHNRPVSSLVFVNEIEVNVETIKQIVQTRWFGEG
eukprot:TRINITY_DN23424_c2_g1_i1.p1 TRINITY_DN23424_c2_g1~~TRINITY_DN23424_c2_g1_i1.p1  ORF type:complete len:105 (+),score=5.90 TRINITY_DN23424_c2_g1_i1:2-316(+)